MDETLEAFVDRGPEALGFLEGIERAEGGGAAWLSRLLSRPPRRKARRQPRGSTMICSASASWATGRSGIYAIEEPKPLMLRETPLGGASADCRRWRFWGQRMAARAMRIRAGDGGAPAESVPCARDRTDHGRGNASAGARWWAHRRDRRHPQWPAFRPHRVARRHPHHRRVRMGRRPAPDLPARPRHRPCQPADGQGRGVEAGDGGRRKGWAI